jgi:hypothetical protein
MTLSRGVGRRHGASYIRVHAAESLALYLSLASHDVTIHICEARGRGYIGTRADNATSAALPSISLRRTLWQIFRDMTWTLEIF